MSSSARTTGRGSRLDQLMNKKARHPWEMGEGGSDEDDDDLADSGTGLKASSTHSKSSSRRRQLLFGNRSNSGRSLLGPAPVISPKLPKTTRTNPPSSSGGATPTAPESLSPKPITPTSPKKKKRDKSSRRDKASRRSSTGNSDTLRGSKHREQQDNDDGPPELAPYGRSNTDGQIQRTSNVESTSISTPGEVEQIKPRPKELSPRPRSQKTTSKQQKRHKKKANKKNKHQGDDATSDHELLGIDFEADGDALREALGAEVLAMWDAQGLYTDLPELRPAILKGVVEQKFQALVEEQNALREKVLLTQNGRAKSSSIGIGSLGAPDDDCAMSIIAEGSEEEDDESSDEEEELPKREEMPTLAEEESLDDSQSTGKEKGEKIDADPALNTSGVMDELQHRLEEMDTSGHHCVEAEGCLGQVERDVPISDQHAFNKFKLRDAVEKRVSAIFTEDHKVIVTESFDEETDKTANNDDDEKKDNGEVIASVNTTTDSKSPKVELRKGLTESFQTFDKLAGAKAPDVSADDEWTECSASVAKNQVKPLDKNIVQRIASRVGGSNTDVDYEEFTVAEQSTYDEVTVQGEELNVDTLSQEKKKTKEKNDNDSDSYLEYTVKEEEPPKSALKKKSSKVESLSSSLSMVDSLSKNKDQVSASKSRQSTLDDLGGSFFPTINTTVMDDDDMTQLTFDHTMDGMNSVTQDHHHADAYFKNRGNVTPSPPRKYHSADSQQTDPTRASTSQQLMDDSANSHNNSEASSTDLSSQAAAALAKSVAKVLRVEVWSPKASVAQAAMEKLFQAASIGSYQRSNITRLGGIIAILRCMQMHTPNVSIQLAACKTLQKLSVDRETQISIGDVGGISAVAASMQSHMDTVELQVSGCKLLSIITSQRSTEETEGADDDDDVPTDGAVSALVATMMHYSTNSDIQAYAFGALANLCLDSRDNLQELSEAGGLTTMTLALQRPWKNKMDQHEAISTLSILLRSLAELGPARNSTSVDC